MNVWYIAKEFRRARTIVTWEPRSLTCSLFRESSVLLDIAPLALTTFGSTPPALVVYHSASVVSRGIFLFCSCIPLQGIPRPRDGRWRRNLSPKNHKNRFHINIITSLKLSQLLWMCAPSESVNLLYVKFTWSLEICCFWFFFVGTHVHCVSMWWHLWTLYVTFILVYGYFNTRISLLDTYLLLIRRSVQLISSSFVSMASWKLIRQEYFPILLLYSSSSYPMSWWCRSHRPFPGWLSRGLGYPQGAWLRLLWPLGKCWLPTLFATKSLISLWLLILQILCVCTLTQDVG
jgi:hypothetical protein